MCFFKTFSLMLISLLSFSTPGMASPEIGRPAPSFTTDDTMGQTISLADFKGKTVVLEWTNPDCPFVHKHYDTGNMQALQKEAVADGVIWIAIDSSAKGKEGNYQASELNTIYATRGAAYSHLVIDELGDIGRQFGAKTTPHMFVINADGDLVYSGAIDNTPTADKDDVKTAKNYVRQALSDIKAGQPVTTPSTNPYGCSVKY